MSYRVREVAERAGVPEAFVRRLIAAGALPGEEQGLGPREVRRARLLHSWEAAGMSIETIVALVERGALSLAFLDAPVMETPERLDRSYAQLAADRQVPLALVQGIHQATGFAPPEAGDRAGEDDVTMLELAELFRGAGVDDDATLRLLAVYADSVRRMAKAEADYYEANVERRLRATGLDERQLIEFGTRLGGRVVGSLERAIFQLYRRHREHVWTEHAINHVEEALEGSGLRERVPRPPAICFVDLTGFMRLTEQRGDEVAARVAGALAALVNDISRGRGGRPVRWLGDGGMFHFREPGAAVTAGLDMVERAPAAGLPPAHVGIHTGAVVAQDGDVYGMTVNLAARISSYAEAGQVVVSEETAARAGAGLRFEPLGPVELKNVARPLPLYRALRGP
ncbi:MAG TPA: adenylate/guanylate cyclase domain-containing protein [Actinomycetota bacterium]|nr:adenylate/guanylate cyclase domain-containing protein [Actinomycetota bacterium]